jgi:hypothetical protein
VNVLEIFFGFFLTAGLHGRVSFLGPFGGANFSEFGSVLKGLFDNNFF